MIHTNNPEINVEELMQRIRAEVAQRKAACGGAGIDVTAPKPCHAADAKNSSGEQFSGINVNMPELPPMPVQPEFHPKSGGRYHINDLLCFHDEAFINAAYRCILMRSPDMSGSQHFLRMLRNGCAKVDILGRLRYSEDGRSAGVKISGLIVPFFLQQVYRIPVIGRIAQILSVIWHLPNLERNQRAFENHVILLMEQAQRHLNESRKTFYTHIQKSLIALQHKMNKELQPLASGVAQLQERIEGLHQCKLEEAELERVRQELTAAIGGCAQRRELTELTNHLVGLVQNRVERQELQPLASGVAQLQERIEGLQQCKLEEAELERVRQELTAAIGGGCAERRELTELTNHLVGLVQNRVERQELQPLASGVAQLQERIEGLQQSKLEESEFERVRQELTAAIGGCAQRRELTELNRLLSIQAHNMKRNLLDQDRRLGLLLDEARKRLPEPISIGQIETMLMEDDHRLDAMYATFEDHFRGTREDIKERVSIYLPMIQEVTAGSVELPVLDLGCGRGEWLELLKDNGLVATGVDINRIFLDGCRELGLEVVEKEAVSYLRGLKPNSVGAVTAFHLIEHLPFKTLIALMDETLRVLAPGGMVILETPNPANLITGSCNFYVDPTHRNPLPGPLTQYLLDARGFCRTQFMPLHPYGETPDRLTAGDPQMQRVINQFLFGPQDYAVVGYKA